jgi:hypothetical protein
MLTTYIMSEISSISISSAISRYPERIPVWVQLREFHSNIHLDADERSFMLPTGRRKHFPLAEREEGFPFPEGEYASQEYASLRQNVRKASHDLKLVIPNAVGREITERAVRYRFDKCSTLSVPCLSLPCLLAM